jgi:hypothetical protein
MRLVNNLCTLLAVEGLKYGSGGDISMYVLISKTKVSCMMNIIVLR